MNWHIWKCSGIVCSCSTERGIRERENEMSGIVIEKVRKSFDTKDGVVEALKDVNLNIDSGDIYGIIGMSGAGKSTLVRCMNFLEVPTEGQVLIDGKALGDLTEKELRKQREEIGMIFQHFNLLMQKSVIDNVCFPLYIKGKKKAEARKRAAELLEIVGLGDRQNAYPAQLSGGQKQRVAIARALASDPKILLCDEATSALDPQTTSSILELLKKINKQFGITIVIITHQMSVVREICTHVAIMYEGEVVEKGLVADIFANPLHPYTEALFSAIPMPDPDLKRNRIILEGNIPSPANPPKGCKFHTRCRKCMEICKNQVPEVKDMGNGHKVRCHLYD